MPLLQSLYFDFVISKDELAKLPKDKKGGIYFFFDKSGDVVYIGKTTNLSYRVKLHIKGQTHSRSFSYLFEQCGIYYIDDKKERDVAEDHFIFLLKPYMNMVEKRLWENVGV